MTAMSVFFSIVVLLLIASLVKVAARRFCFPYTILLFLMGMLLIPLGGFLHIDIFASFSLTPDLLFLVFLPVLIFESGYHINRQQLRNNAITLWVMATAGLAISTLLVGFGLYWLGGWLGFVIPLELSLLFGVIISATDPVAVLSIFKRLGTPQRLNLLFEGESLFNDGTAVAVFLLLIEIFGTGGQDGGALVWHSVFSWFVMIVGGILLGLFLGVVFAKSLQYIKNHEAVEITLTVLLAHMTFLSAEYISQAVSIGGFDVHISGVIATAFAAIVMGNYGKTKISPKVEQYMDKFWHFFSFLANSLVFLLMGLLVVQLHLPWVDMLGLLIVAIVLVCLARAVSVYVPMGILNHFRLHEYVPMRWQHMLSRASLRGALGLMLVLLLPSDFVVSGWDFSYSVQDALLVLVIGTTFFSLVIKGLTIKSLAHRLGLDDLQQLECFEQLETEILIYYAILQKITSMRQDNSLTSDRYEYFARVYREKLTVSQHAMQSYLKKCPDPQALVVMALRLHALGTEKQCLQDMFLYNECSEYIYLYIAGKLERQSIRVKKGMGQLTAADHAIVTDKTDFFLPIIRRLFYKKHDHVEEYIIARTRFLITQKVLFLLRDLQSKEFGYPKDLFVPIIALYEDFHSKAWTVLTSLRSKHESLSALHTSLLRKSLMKTEEQLITDLYDKNMITHKIYQECLAAMESRLV